MTPHWSSEEGEGPVKGDRVDRVLEVLLAPRGTAYSRPGREADETRWKCRPGRTRSWRILPAWVVLGVAAQPRCFVSRIG